MNIGAWLERSAAIGPGRSAIYLGCEQVFDYADFDAEARAVAGGLVARGVKPGDRVAIFMVNSPAYLLALYGAWYAGAAVVPINAKLHSAEAGWIIRDAGAGIVLATGKLAQSLGDSDATVIDMAESDALSGAPLAAITARAPGDLAWLFYTCLLYTSDAADEYQRV